MKSYIVKILSLLCVISIYFGVFSTEISAYSTTLSNTGLCGDNVSYTFDSSSGILTLYGTGETKNYLSNGLNSPFNFNDEIKSVIINEGITSIGTGLFAGCSHLSSVSIPNSVIRILSSAFEDCENLTIIELPEGITSLGNCVFKNCSDLSFINIPNSVKTIGNSAFSFCTSLQNITIPDKVIRIEPYTFYNCTSLKVVNLPDNLKNIEGYAFNNCTNLRELIMPCSIKIPDEDVFVNCLLLEKIILKPGTGKMQNYSSNRTTEDLTWYGALPWFCSKVDEIEIIMEDGIEYIGDYAFYNCSNLRKINLPDSVISLGRYSFSSCINLSQINLSKGLTSISNGAFSRTGITSLNIHNNITNICSFAFQYCLQLESVTLPISLSEIENSAFGNCKNLNEVYYFGTIENWKNINIGSDNNYLLNSEIICHTHCYVEQKYKASTCVDSGYCIYYCECGDEYVLYSDPLGHCYNTAYAMKETCIDNGLYIYECSVCGNILTKEVACLGHTSSDVKIENLVESTCIAKGSYYEVTYCTTCGIELSRNTITTNELGHNIVYDEGITVSCTTDGLTQGSHCIRCNEVLIRQEVIPALNHNYVITDSQTPSCTVDGFNTYTCQNCNDSYTEIIEKTGHTNLLYRTTASCEKAGYDVYKCSICSTLTSVKVDTLGHVCNLFNGIVDNELSYSCSRCNKDYTMSASDVLGLWNASVINVSAKEYPELDVVNDGIINAKDYAKLKHLQKYNN